METFRKLKTDGVEFLPESYNSEWYAPNKSLIESHLLVNNGNIPLVYSREYILLAVTTELLSKKYMLDTLYNTMGFDYNPIWNVDGTETVVYTRDNTGTVRDTETINESLQRATDIEETHTGTDANAHTGTTTTADTGTDTTTHTGTETTAGESEENVTHSGTVTTNHTGTDTETHTGTVRVSDDSTDTATTSKTAYNDATFVNAEKVVDDTEKDTTTTYNETRQTTKNLSDAELINTNDVTETDTSETKTLNTTDLNTKNLSSQITHADTITATKNLSDVRDEDSTETRTGSNSNLRTDNLSEEYSETRTRGGNIGVTSTQSLITQEREVARFSFIEVVCKIITDAVCLGVIE